MEFYPCIYCNYSGKICVIVGPKSDYETALKFLIDKYPLHFSRIDAKPIPANTQGLRQKHKYESARLMLCVVENAWDLANSRLAHAETDSARNWAITEFNKSAKEFAIAFWEDTKEVNSLQDCMRIMQVQTHEELQAKHLMYARMLM